MRSYDHKKIEKKWQKKWEEQALYRAEDNSPKPKYYCLVEFPYPSGEGLHTGHIRSYTALDIIARKRRADGYNVLYPIGWDAFGLPTENFAIKTGTPPKTVTKNNTDTFRRQLKSAGFSFDWEREINTTDPTYYKWTQWIFLKMFDHGLAYKAKMAINWCPSCKIGLANEEVVDGKCERCGGPTEKREKEQWMLAITKYADRLDKDLDDVDYLEKIKIQQRNWIGRSEGVEFTIPIADTQDEVRVFTTRIDTVFGMSYVVLAPEHPLVEKLAERITNAKDVRAYVAQANTKTDLERTELEKEKTGVRLEGVEAVNPFNGKKVPVFIADYVLGNYGTGAVMAVPAHDERDFAFAKKYGLPMRYVVGYPYEKIRGIGALLETAKGTFLFQKRDGNAPVEKGKITPFGGGKDEGEVIIDCLKREIREELNFDLKITDARFVVDMESRNRPGMFLSIFHIAGVDPNKLELLEGEAIIEMTIDEALENEQVTEFTKDALRSLSGVLPNIYTTDGILVNSGEFTGLDSATAREKMTAWLEKEKLGKKKVNYKLRDWVFSRQRYWGEPIPIVHCVKPARPDGRSGGCGMVPVPEADLPVVLPEVESYTPTDTGESPLAHIDAWVNTTCPKCGGAAKRETDTMPNWAGSSWYYLRYTDPRNDKMLASEDKLNYWTPVDWYNGGMEHTTLHLLYSRFWHKFLYDIKVVPTHEPYQKRTSHGLILAHGGVKMSKSKGNTVSPDDIVETYGADTLRLYEMFMGPFDQPVSWSMDSIIGPRRFIERVWRLRDKVSDTGDDFSAILHQTIKKVSEDIESMSFNTAVSQMMILGNALERARSVAQSDYEVLLQLLAPFVPHVAEELWYDLGHTTSIHIEPWPAYDSAKLTAQTATIAVQVNGKVRDTFEIEADTTEEEVIRAALAREKVQAWMAGKTVRRTIFVPGKLVNIVVDGNA